MFTTRDRSTTRLSRLGVIALLLGALLAVSHMQMYGSVAPDTGAVVLAQTDGDGEDEDAPAEEAGEAAADDSADDDMDGDGSDMADDAAAGADEDSTPMQYEHLTVEVAENGYERFAVDETPAFEEDGLPAYGAEFVTQGYIYPAGTLTCDDEGCNGVQEDGSPEFPDQVIGEWTCFGFHVGDGAHTETGPWVISTQYYSFGEEPGAESIATTGYEWVDRNVPFLRAIIGGSGAYRYARGEQEQELLHFDPVQGTTLRVTFDMRNW